MSYERAMAKYNDKLEGDYELRISQKRFEDHVFNTKFLGETVIITGEYDRDNEEFTLQKVEWKGVDVTLIIHEADRCEFEKEGKESF